jgi:choline dehydrogenase
LPDPAAWFTLAGTSVDWAFETVPQPGTDNAIHPWPRGKLVGGSSAARVVAVRCRPGTALRRFGIDVVADLPGVGENLHDHTKSQVAYTATRPVRADSAARKPVVLARTEPFAEPDLQMIFLDSPMHPRLPPGPEHGYSVIFSVMTPASRGSVRLASADPKRAPVIDPNYLADDRDVDRMVAGLRRARDIGASPALKDVRDRELFPGPEAETDCELRKCLRRSVSSCFHPVGTCKIGADLMAVVDAQLKVHGISNLRVADASVMPSIVSGNTNAATLAIAERAAALLSGDDELN